MRAEGDTWDIRTSVGSTALFVAAARGLAARGPQPLALDRFAEMFCRAAGDEWVALFDADEKETRDHPLRTPGFGTAFQTHISARTKYFDDYLVAAAADGVRQVVILAAGLDSRSYRLAWPDDMVVYELDRQPVLDFKRDVLAENGVREVVDRREVAVDLRENWPHALRAAGFDPTAPTAWLVEGLLIYLPPAAQDRLFDAIDTLSASGSFVAIEQMATLDRDTYAGMTAQQGEGGAAGGGAEWARLIYNDQRSDPPEWFAGRGWNSESIGMVDYVTSLGRSFPAVDPETSRFSPSLITLITLSRPGNGFGSV